MLGNVPEKVVWSGNKSTVHVGEMVNLNGIASRLLFSQSLFALVGKVVLPFLLGRFYPSTGHEHMGNQSAKPMLKVAKRKTTLFRLLFVGRRHMRFGEANIEQCLSDGGKTTKR